MQTIIATHGTSAASLLTLAGLALACSTSHGQSAGPNGGGGGSDGGTELTGGSAGMPGGSGGADAGPACVVGDPSTLPGRITAPNPLISLGRPVVAGGPIAIQNQAQLVDGLRNGTSGIAFGVPTDSTPAWAAIDLGTGPSRVLLIWRDTGTGAYTNVLGGAPYDYRIETSADSTDGVGGTWNTVATVTANPVHVREHAFDFSGQRWVKLVVTAALPSPDAGASDAGIVYDVRLDEISVFDLSAADGGLPSDTWFFMGDSITQGAFPPVFGAGTRFDDLLHAAHTAYDPAMVPGGITSEFATDGVRHINQDHWLELNPDMTHVAIGYGTNDSWGNKNPVTVGFEATLETLVTAVMAAGRVPILARIPYACEDPNAARQHTTVAQFNQIIDRLQAKYGLPCGPDLYSWFAAHPEQLADCVHPNSIGYKQMNQLWADAAGVLYPSN